MEWQFAAQAWTGRSPQLLNQEAINAFVEPTPKEGKTQLPVYGTPGLSLFSRMGNGPILGAHVMGMSLYVLSGPDLYYITQQSVLSAGLGNTVEAIYIGRTTISTLASMADNAQQLVMVDGDVGWIYQPGGLYQTTTETAVAGSTEIPANITGTITAGDPLVVGLDNGAIFQTTALYTVSAAGGTIYLTDPIPSQLTAGAIIIDQYLDLAAITAPAFMPASTVRYFDGYFVFAATNTRQFFLSSINDGTQYSGLDYATATAGSDYIIAVEIYHEQLLLMCGLHIEIWWNSGAAAFPFQRYDAAEIARGLASRLAVVSEDNTVFWMGEDGIFYRLNNFLPQRVSTFSTEHAWAQYPLKYLDCSGFCLDQEGHKFIILNFPSGLETLCYDIAASGAIGVPLWHQRQSRGSRTV
jgi:hypothetical protein